MTRIFEQYLRGVDATESTRATYRKALESFSRWLDGIGLDPIEAVREDILAYKDSLVNAHKAAMTINLYLSAVRNFYRWAEGEHLCGNVANGIASVRTKKDTFRKMHLENEQGAQLLTEAYLPKTVSGMTPAIAKKMKANEEVISMRNYAMLNLMLRTGLRTIEVSRADVGDITFKKERRILRVWGKGHSEKDDFVVLTDEAYLPIKQYLEYRPEATPSEPLFTTVGFGSAGKRMSTRTIQSICKDTLRAIGLDGHEYSAHSLRHTTGTQILKNGGTMFDVQNVLRHSTPVTSQLYVNTIMEDKRLEDASEALLDGSFK